MRVICNTESLNGVCQKLRSTVSSKAPFPSIEGIYMRASENKLFLTGYDLEVGMSTYVDAVTEEDGGIILNAGIFCDILSKLPSEKILIEADERQLCIIRSGEAEYKLVGISAEEYPELPTVTGGYPVLIESEILKNMIKQTIFAVSNNETTSVMVHTGIKFEIKSGQLRLIALDGFRLAIRTEHIDYTGEDISFIVPKKTLKELEKLSDEGELISMNIAKHHFITEIGNYTVISRLLDGNFLDYNAAVPKSLTTEVIVNSKLFADSIDRVSTLVTTDKFKSPLRFIFDENLIKISTQTSIGTADDRLPAKISGNRVEIGFNAKFLKEALSNTDSEEVKITMNGPQSPMTIIPTEGDKFLYLVLPVVLGNEN